MSPLSLDAPRKPARPHQNGAAPRPRRGTATFGCACAIAAVWLACVASSTAAQQLPTGGKQKTAVLFSTSSTKGGTAPLDSVIHAALEELNVVTVVGRPGMDLNAVQLAIDCVSESPQCLRAVAGQTNAQVLIAPSLQSTPSELVISVLRFDTSDGQMRRVVRRQSGSTLRSETLDGVPAMLRELFGLPEPAPKAPEAAPPVAGEQLQPEPAPLIEPPQEPEEGRSLSAGPFILGGAGVLVLGGGAIMGAVFQSNNDKYNAQPEARNDDEAAALSDLRDTTKTQAAIANVLYGVGAAALVAGGIWLAVELSQPARSETDWQTAVVPAVGPGQLGLSIVHRGGIQ